MFKPCHVQFNDLFLPKEFYQSCRRTLCDGETCLIISLKRLPISGDSGLQEVLSVVPLLSNALGPRCVWIMEKFG